MFVSTLSFYTVFKNQNSLLSFNFLFRGTGLQSFFFLQVIIHWIRKHYIIVDWKGLHITQISWPLELDIITGKCFRLPFQSYLTIFESEHMLRTVSTNAVYSKRRTVVDTTISHPPFPFFYSPTYRSVVIGIGWILLSILHVSLVFEPANLDNPIPLAAVICSGKAEIPIRDKLIPLFVIWKKMYY